MRSDIEHLLIALVGVEILPSRQHAGEELDHEVSRSPGREEFQDLRFEQVEGGVSQIAERKIARGVVQIDDLPIVIDQASRRVLVCWTADRALGLDPASGEIHWEYPTPWKKWPIAIATPVLYENRLLCSDAHGGTFLLQLSHEKPTAKKLWHRHKRDNPDGEGMHCLISTPLVQGQYVYGADNRGVLRCLELKTGEQGWEDRTAVPENSFATIHLIRNGKRIWMFNERGELIISRLTPEGFQEISRAKLIEPTREQLRRRDGVTWSHPAFAYRHIFARNDKELVAADLSKK